MRHPLPRRGLAPALVVLATVCFASVSWANHIVGTSCNTTAECAGHENWPRMTQGDVQKAKQFQGTTLRGKPNNSDELLGWHGSDNLYGEEKSDVLWADHVGTGQPTSQWDRIWGGAGNDFIYSARGRNTIYGEEGNDAIKARYGRGVVDCGPGRDIVHVPKSRKKNWTFKSCEKFEYRSESATGHGLKPLP
jgi:hypothetical protein